MIFPQPWPRTLSAETEPWHSFITLPSPMLPELYQGQDSWYKRLCSPQHVQWNRRVLYDCNVGGGCVVHLPSESRSCLRFKQRSCWNDTINDESDTTVKFSHDGGNLTCNLHAPCTFKYVSTCHVSVDVTLKPRRGGSVILSREQRSFETWKICSCHSTTKTFS